MKSILLIGLGRFGATMAMKLHELKHEVMAIDISEERINAILPYVTSAQIGDCTNEQYMSSIGVRNFDLCIVAIGDNFQSSLETTALLKDLGAKFVLSRANRDIHAKFLLRNGADQVVYPEKEMAIRSAVRYSTDNIFDYIELTPDHSIYEVPVPSSWIEKSIVQINVRNNTTSPFWPSSWERSFGLFQEQITSLWEMKRWSFWGPILILKNFSPQLNKK